MYLITMQSDSAAIHDTNSLSPVLTDPLSDPDGSDDLAQHRNYYCQRCLNHRMEVPRKSHKCPYKSQMHSMECLDCRLVDERRFLNQKIEKKKDNVEDKFVDVVELDEDSDSGPKIRNPKCAKCRIHGRKIDLKGHKRKCPFDSPEHAKHCEPCGLVGCRRKVMSRQVWLRRKQQSARDVVESYHRSLSASDLPNGSLVRPTPIMPSLSLPVSTKAFDLDLPQAAAVNPGLNIQFPPYPGYHSHSILSAGISIPVIHSLGPLTCRPPCNAQCSAPPSCCHHPHFAFANPSPAGHHSISCPSLHSHSALHPPLAHGHPALHPAEHGYLRHHSPQWQTLFDSDQMRQERFLSESLSLSRHLFPQQNHQFHP